MLRIVFYWQGEELYSIELPDNISKVTFDSKETEPYASLHILIPVVTEIEFQENRTCQKSAN